jgi:hypothetical protein
MAVVLIFDDWLELAHPTPLVTASLHRLLPGDSASNDRTANDIGP